MAGRQLDKANEGALGIPLDKTARSPILDGNGVSGRQACDGSCVAGPALVAITLRRRRMAELWH